MYSRKENTPQRDRMLTDMRTDALIDPFGRSITYLRVSVTDRCDLRCTYCLPRHFKGYEEPDDWLRFDELTRVVGAFVRLGVHRVRLTGGEPLLRRNLAELAAQLAALPGLRDLSLSTNGTQLAHQAVALRAAGVRRLNVSLDSLSPSRLAEMVGRDVLAQVMAGLHAAQAAGFAPIKINCVLTPGSLHASQRADLEALVAFCFAQGFILRLIENMPLGETAQALGSASLEVLRTHLVQRFGLEAEVIELDGGPARYWKQREGSGRIGFITPISQHFCATCNRVRLSVDGTLYLCLGQNDRVPLRTRLRAGISDADLIATLREAITHKPERHEFHEKPRQILRFMSQTGG